MHVTFQILCKCQEIRLQSSAILEKIQSRGINNIWLWQPCFLFKFHSYELDYFAASSTAHYLLLFCATCVHSRFLHIHGCLTCSEVASRWPARYPFLDRGQTTLTWPLSGLVWCMSICLIWSVHLSGLSGLIRVLISTEIVCPALLYPGGFAKGFQTTFREWLYLTRVSFFYFSPDFSKDLFSRPAF